MSLLAVALALAFPQHGVLVPGRSLGGVQLGMTPAAGASTPGARTYGRCRGCTQKTWYFNYEKFHAEGAAVRFRKGRVDAVWTLWKPPGWHVGKARARRPGARRSPAAGARSSPSRAARTRRASSRRGGVTTVFYVYGDKLWGFGLSRPGASPCH